MFSLKAFNTFGIDANTHSFTEVNSVEELRLALNSAKLPIWILGGGSNILLTGDLQRHVIRNAIGGISVIRDYAHCVHVSVGGGVVWHDFVQWAVQHQLGGIENLSLIPGTVGAAPIQNIGAYGVELKDIFVKLEAIELSTAKKRVFSKENCQFGYRDSIFKHEAANQYCITRVVFRLEKVPHTLNIGYGDIQKVLSERGIVSPTIADVSAAVCSIRSAKLPNPAELGNSGSFFKNPVISESAFATLKLSYPEIPNYPAPDGYIKVPAGWLIEQCGWKGKRVGNTGSHAKQALVLVNYGGATGLEVWQLAQAIIDSVHEKFGIILSAEVNIVG